MGMGKELDARRRGSQKRKARIAISLSARALYKVWRSIWSGGDYTRAQTWGITPRPRTRTRTHGLCAASISLLSLDHYCFLNLSSSKVVVSIHIYSHLHLTIYSKLNYGSIGDKRITSPLWLHTREVVDFYLEKFR
jgi:hypothetical protein